MDEHLVIYVASVPVLGIAAQFIAYWTRLPSILLLLAFGILLGTIVNPDDLLAEIYHSDNAQSIAPQILFPLVSLCVGVILFEGGLSLRLGELKESGQAVVRLCTLGALITWICIGMLAWMVFKLPPSLAALLGAVLVVTGPTVVGPMLRFIRPKGRVGSIVKWEGIVIDPDWSHFGGSGIRILFCPGQPFWFRCHLDPAQSQWDWGHPGTGRSFGVGFAIETILDPRSPARRHSTFGRHRSFCDIESSTA